MLHIRMVFVKDEGIKKACQKRPISTSSMEELIDEVDINNSNVKVDLHLTSPFCPAVFGFKICQDVHDNLLKVDENFCDKPSCALHN